MGGEKFAGHDPKNIASYITELKIVENVENLSTKFVDNSKMEHNGL
jgi:hypothetical protein